MLTRLRQAMAADKIGAFLTCDSHNIRWLTGWQQLFDGDDAHVALVTQTDAWIHSDSRYSNTMRERNNGEWHVNDERVGHSKFIATTLQEQNIQNVTIDDTMPLRQYRALEEALAGNAKLNETSGYILKLRAIKTASELALIRKAQTITDAAFTHMLGWLAPGISELEAANELEHFMRAQGAEGLAFPSIVAGGPNSANPHAVPTGRRLQPGDFVVMDFGARYRDYCSDMTRTVCIGPPSDEQQRIYNTVLAAHEAGKRAIAPGVPAKDVHEAAAAVIAQAGYGEHFLHSLGHGVGIEVHEEPTLHPKSEDILQVGNVVTVEPGIYLPGVGGVRIEDFGVTDKNGFSNLTTSTHPLQII